MTWGNLFEGITPELVVSDEIRGESTEDGMVEPSWFNHITHGMLHLEMHQSKAKGWRGRWSCGGKKGK
jgi:hypothetical protein